jgi:hypothetical protein
MIVVRYFTLSSILLTSEIAPFFCVCPIIMHSVSGNIQARVCPAGPPLWSSGQEFLATDPETRVRFPALPEKKVVGLEPGPLSLVNTNEELLDRK